MARNFSTVLKNIIAIAPKELAEPLKKDIKFWAPEILWDNLSRYVNRYVIPSSKDSRSIAIYAELCDLSWEEMKLGFEKDGL